MPGHSDPVAVGRFGAAHGVRGEIRLKSYTGEPLAVAGYGPLVARDGRRFEIVSARPAAGGSPEMLVVTVEGVATREQAKALSGLDLFVPRDGLPEAGPDEFYHADLVGLSAVTIGGQPLGTVVAVQNYGAGDLLEIAPARGATILVPFTRAAVPVVDLGEGRVSIDPPPGLLDGGAAEGGKAEDEGG